MLCVHGAASMDRWILCMRLKYFGWFAKNSTTTLNQTKLNALDSRVNDLFSINVNSYRARTHKPTLLDHRVTSHQYAVIFFRQFTLNMSNLINHIVQWLPNVLMAWRCERAYCAHTIHNIRYWLIRWLVVVVFVIEFIGNIFYCVGFGCRFVWCMFNKIISFGKQFVVPDTMSHISNDKKIYIYKGKCVRFFFSWYFYSSDIVLIMNLCFSFVAIFSGIYHWFAGICMFC